MPRVRNASEYNSFADLRPISVTPILSKLTEKIVVRKYPWPFMDNEQMRDQFAFRPTGSTTAALIDLMHLLYSMFDQGNDYVRCILIDYGKALDVVNPRLPEVFRVTLLPEVGYIIPQSTMLLIWLITLHQELKKLTFHLFFMFLRSRYPFLTFSQSCHVCVTSKI